MEWKKRVEDQIAIIRAYNPRVIPLVAGFDWAYDLTRQHHYFSRTRTRER